MFIMFGKILNYYSRKGRPGSSILRSATIGWNLFTGRRLGVAADNNAHDFEVQNEEPDNLPGEKLAPEPGGTGGIGWIVNAFWAGGYGFCLHFADFNEKTINRRGYSGIRNQKGFALAL